jgi:hypothetical protein
VPKKRSKTVIDELYRKLRQATYVANELVEGMKGGKGGMRGKLIVHAKGVEWLNSSIVSELVFNLDQLEKIVKRERAELYDDSAD